jgi:serine/threonine-protein kinase
MSVDNDSLAATGILEVAMPGQAPAAGSRGPGSATGPAPLSLTSSPTAGLASSLAAATPASLAASLSSSLGAAETSAVGSHPSSGSLGAGLAAARLVGGRYEILGLIGQGGMGRVYRARDTELDEIVALKVLQNDLVSSPEMVERFRREVKLARRVTHPNVARMFDIGTRQAKNSTFLLTYDSGHKPPFGEPNHARRAPTRSPGITLGSRA